MNQEIIDKLLLNAIVKAKELKVQITVSIVDKGGQLVALRREEECSYFGIEASRKKALTASQLKIPSHVLNDISIQFPELKRSLDSNPDIELLPGGFPLFCDDQVIGGIGISGGNFDQDRLIAEFASNLKSTPKPP